MNRSHSGMTLIEVVLATGLLVLLGMFVTGTMRSVLELWRTGERQGQNQFAMQAASSRLAADLRALHRGPRGWLILDTWEARRATADQEAWRLPRLRFLARGDALRLDDPSGRNGLEVAWMLVPGAGRGRLGRWMRLVQPEGSDPSFRSDRAVETLARSGQGMTVLDGVVWARIQIEEANGDRSFGVNVAADVRVNFPVALHLLLERVAGDSRRRPPTLDRDLGMHATRAQFRGSFPLQQPEFALLEDEWVRLSGRLPAPTLSERGARESLATMHSRGAPMLLPQARNFSYPLPADGRRIRP